jgi:hypothetical protein
MPRVVTGTTVSISLCRVKLTGEKTDTNCVDVAGRLLGLRSGVLTSVNARAVSKDRRLYTRGSDNEFVSVRQ